MTNQDAVNYFKEYLEFCEKARIGQEYYEPQALALASLQKQVPESPIKAWDSTKGDKTYYRYVCRGCENELKLGDAYKYCPYCGQALDWEDHT